MKEAPAPQKKPEAKVAKAAQAEAAGNYHTAAEGTADAFDSTDNKVRDDDADEAPEKEQALKKKPVTVAEKQTDDSSADDSMEENKEDDDQDLQVNSEIDQTELLQLDPKPIENYLMQQAQEFTIKQKLQGQ